MSHEKYNMKKSLLLASGIAVFIGSATAATGEPGFVGTFFDSLAVAWNTFVGEMGTVGQTFTAMIIIAFAGLVGKIGTGDIGAVFLMALTMISMPLIGLLPAWIVFVLIAVAIIYMVFGRGV